MFRYIHLMYFARAKMQTMLLFCSLIIFGRVIFISVRASESCEKSESLSESFQQNCNTNLQFDDFRQMQPNNGNQNSVLNGEDADPIARERRNKVREMMLHAWKNYKKYAWGKNELRPLSKGANNDGAFGANEVGLTIIDSLDTLYIMNLNAEYEEGHDWVARHFTFRNVKSELSVFETNIRIVGGFLSMYALTGDLLYREKAQEVADKLLPAFQTPTGIPNGRINIRTGFSSNDDDSTSLAEIGSLHLEFSYLSDITGNPVYRERVMNIRRILSEIEKPDGLYRKSIDPLTGKWVGGLATIGPNGDSFYEYLLKSWIQSNQTDANARQMYDKAMEAIVSKQIKTSPGGLIYACTNRYKFDQVIHEMHHFACFAGGLFALGAATQQDQNSERYMEIGKGITNTCHESYIRSATHLGPEIFGFCKNIEANTLDWLPTQYILRPETFESYFILWRLTKDEKYREWGWDAVQAIEKYCKTPSGYSGIEPVYSDDPVKDDVQPSFFLAEGLKYLYLLYSDDSLLPLNEWVFNTEAHPLPIKGNPMYREANSGTIKHN